MLPPLKSQSKPQYTEQTANPATPITRWTLSNCLTTLTAISRLHTARGSFHFGMKRKNEKGKYHTSNVSCLCKYPLLTIIRIEAILSFTYSCIIRLMLLRAWCMQLFTFPMVVPSSSAISLYLYPLMRSAIIIRCRGGRCIMTFSSSLPQ